VRRMRPQQTFIVFFVVEKKCGTVVFQLNPHKTGDQSQRKGQLCDWRAVGVIGARRRRWVCRGGFTNSGVSTTNKACVIHQCAPLLHRIVPVTHVSNAFVRCFAAVVRHCLLGGARTAAIGCRIAIACVASTLAVEPTSIVFIAVRSCVDALTRVVLKRDGIFIASRRILWTYSTHRYRSLALHVANKQNGGNENQQSHSSELFITHKASDVLVVAIQQSNLFNCRRQGQDHKINISKATLVL
jgi:hypothetical protein